LGLVMIEETDGPFARLMPMLIEIANSRPVFGPKRDVGPDDQNAATYDLIESTGMVFAIWEDAAKSQGHSAILVKGYDKLRELYTLVAQPREGNWPWTVTAIKCVDADWAERLGDLIQKFFPDMRTH
jgi:hypothetical protein